MILVDTSVWIDHLRTGVPDLVALLETAQVLTHPFVIGELALGNLRDRAEVLNTLQDLPGATVANHAEVLHFIEQRGLAGRGIGYVDAHLLTSLRLTGDALLWTHDRRLAEVAERLGLAAQR